MRRRLVLVVLVLSVLGLSACSSTDDEDLDSRPVPLQDFKATLSLKPAWEVSTDAESKDLFSRLQPAVWHQQVYVAGSNGTVEAHALASGKLIWRKSLDMHIESGAAAAAGLVIVGSAEGDVVALDANSGKVLWHALVSSEVLAPAAIAEGVVAVRTVDGKLFVLEQKNGKRRWFFDRSVPVLTLRGTSEPIIAHGAVVSGFDTGKVGLLLVKDGKPIWQTRIAQSVGRSELERIVDMDVKPLLLDSVLYVVTYNGNIAALDFRTGRNQWQREMSSFQNIGTDGRRLFVTSADDVVRALDKNGGGTFWNQTGLKNRQLTAPVSAGDYVVVGDFEGYLHWLDVGDGTFAERMSFDSDGFSGDLVVADGYLLAQGKSGKLMAVKFPESTYR